MERIKGNEEKENDCLMFLNLCTKLPKIYECVYEQEVSVLLAKRKQTKGHIV